MKKLFLATLGKCHPENYGGTCASHTTARVSDEVMEAGPGGFCAKEGTVQVVFLEADEICETSYADKKGKYQAQREITLPRI